MSSLPSTPDASERTPLLARSDEESQTPHSQEPIGRAALSETSTELIDDHSGKSRRRWPTIIALTLLCVAVIIGCVGFAAPSLAKEYAQEALVFEPDRLSVDSFTSFGVRARIQGVVYLDASRVSKKYVRDLGKVATWMVKEVECRESDVQVFLPQYGNALLGNAQLPAVKLNIRNTYYNHLDLFVDVEPGDVDGIRTVAKDFLDGNLKVLTVKAIAKLPLKSGLLNLGTHTVDHVLRFEGSDVPDVPDLDIRKLVLAEYGPPGHPSGVKATATVSLMNDFPVSFDVPPLGFEVLLPDCFEDYLKLCIARTDTLHVMPKQMVNASVTGTIKQLRTSLTTACPGSGKSPLDSLVADYLSGRDTTVYIRGGEQEQDTPEWIAKLLQDTTLPFSLPGHPFDNLIKEFSLADVHFSLPDPLSNDTRPKISAVVKVLVGLPEEMNVNLDVDQVRADADVFYKGHRMGKLDLRKWQAANATKHGEDLLIQSVVDNAPLEVTDNDVFSKVVRQLVFGNKGVELGVEANVDANTQTALGHFVVRNIPAQGKIHVKPISRRGFATPDITDMQVVDSSPDRLVLQARVNLTNPTEYSAHVPHVNVSIAVNGTRVGYAWTSADIVPGNNSLTMHASWEVGKTGREWLSQFVSGYNTSLTIQTHANSIPSLPDVGLELTIPAPHMFSKFLQQATVR